VEARDEVAEAPRQEAARAAPRRDAPRKAEPPRVAKAKLAEDADWNGPVPDFLRFST
jgi:hypothetical protein